MKNMLEATIPLFGKKKENYNIEIGDEHSADMYILTISDTHYIICWIILIPSTTVFKMSVFRVKTGSRKAIIHTKK
jgi:hypothetical protein